MKNLLGRTVYEGESKTGKNFFICYLKDGDAEIMRDYITTISKERTFISYQGEPLSLEEEKRFVGSQVGKIKEGKCVVLLVFSENILVGVANLDLGERTSKHIANLGISIAKGFRDEGIGSKLLETLLDEGTKNLKDLEIIKLTVFSSNAGAISLYKKFGFKEYGRLPDGVKLEGSYVDQVKMYKSLN